MIVTVTPNPSLDRTLQIDSLERGEVMRSGRAQVDPGGKGINVVRVLTGNGHAGIAVFPAGGTSGQELIDLLSERGITPRVTAIAGSVRTNVALVEPDGTVTKINEPGPTMSPEEVDALLAATADAAIGASWVVSCGSLPDGAPEDLHARIVDRAQDAGARSAVDTSGAPLLACLDSSPDLVKPNEEELAEAVNGTLLTIGDAVEAAQVLRALGAVSVLASLGAAGAIYVAADLVLHAESPAVRPVSSVGAGDSTLTGFLTEAEPHAALRAAVAFGTAAVQLPGSSLPKSSDIHLDRVQVTEDINLDRSLTSDRQHIDLAHTGGPVGSIRTLRSAERQTRRSAT